MESSLVFNLTSMDDRDSSSESPTAANMDERLSRTVTSLDHLIGELSNTELAIRRIVVILFQNLFS